MNITTTAKMKASYLTEIISNGVAQEGNVLLKVCGQSYVHKDIMFKGISSLIPPLLCSKFD